MLRRAFLSLLAISMIAGISGCGFQLRGYLNVPEQLQQVSVVSQTGQHQLVNSLIGAMQLNKLQIVADAPYKLELVSINESRRSATLDTRAKVDEYELKLQVRFKVLGPDDKAALTEQTLITERVYTYDADAAAAAEEQERLLKQEMSDDLALQIVRRYLAINPAP